jgi:hypothetical protein
MNVYTDPRLVDVRGALDVLPALPLHSKSACPCSLIREPEWLKVPVHAVVSMQTVVPPWEDLIAQRDAVVKRHPKTRPHRALRLLPRMDAADRRQAVAGRAREVLSCQWGAIDSRPYAADQPPCSRSRLIRTKKQELQRLRTTAGERLRLAISH